ncbi:MAG TPA: TonB-dependent receptor plug domain-containing protein [Polyangiales bacterium]|nr:TonB-dependent receptor plug domain-containing protein [Polyangiales bacterium]
MKFDLQVIWIARRAGRWSALLALTLFARTAAAQVVEAEPVSPIVVPFPAFPSGAQPSEAQVTLHVVVDAAGAVESAVEVLRMPQDSPDELARAAIDAVKAAQFSPSSRDGRPFRSRIEYVVVFHPPEAPSATEPAAPAPTARPPVTQPAAAAPPEQPVEAAPAADPAGRDASYGAAAKVHRIAWASPRGIGDIRVDRDTLTASPRQHTSEMLSAAPGFFVDHEDGEGLGNDVYLRGFDLDNGSGIEMKVGEIPINIPLHIHGQGYADVNFMIPEVVNSIRVLEGPYDPRQGDAAIVGSALFDLAVPARGYRLKTTYGSFGQARVLAIAAPHEASDETFAAFAVRQTAGFGQNRASKSASVNAQYSVDLTDTDHLRVFTAANATQSELAGSVREDDVNAGRIGFYDTYPHYNSYYPAYCTKAACAIPAQGVSTQRVIVGAELDHVTNKGGRFAIAPWFMWTNFLSRQNYTGNLNSSNLQPQLASLGDLWELANVETAAGATASFHTAPLRFGNFLEVVAEPGVSIRLGHTNQGKNLVNPANFNPWDYLSRYGLQSVDIAGYVDLDVRLWKNLRVSGGMRVDFLDVAIDNRLSGVLPPVPDGSLRGSKMSVAGVAPSPRVTVAYEALPAFVPVISAGLGFRSLSAFSLTLCNAAVVATTRQLPPCEIGSPYSQVTSFEAGFRSVVGQGRFTTTLTAFQTYVANELVFAVDSGGYETQRASTRRGIVGSLLARPTPWLLVSTALSLQTATFDTLVAGTSHYVPEVPAYLWRTDVNANGTLLRVNDAPLTGRIGIGYTLLGGRHVNDRIMAPTNNVLNAQVSFRYRFVELAIDMYNVLGLQYADSLAFFVSNWSFQPGQGRASTAVHTTAATPRTTMATLTLDF